MLWNARLQRGQAALRAADATMAPAAAPRLSAPPDPLSRLPLGALGADPVEGLHCCGETLAVWDFARTVGEDTLKLTPFSVDELSAKARTTLDKCKPFW